MVKIAIVEDSLSDANRMQEYLERWRASEGEEIQVSIYQRAWDFLSSFNGQFDIIFLDIMLPDKNGVDTAKCIRKVDESVIIVFTTNMKQYAINGYEVNALDFVLKPIRYNRFVLLMKKCVSRIQRDANRIQFRVPGTTYSIDVDDIVFVESNGHSVIYNLRNGQTIKKRATLGEVEKQLPVEQFARCSVSFLINLKYVDSIEGEFVIVNDTKLKLTRSKNREFRKAFVGYYS